MILNTSGNVYLDSLRRYMEIVVLGLAYEIRYHSMVEICMFLLVYAMLLMLIGRYIERRRVSKAFMRLIRYGNERIWWRRLEFETILFAWALITVVFLVGYVEVMIGQKEHISRMIILSYVLWILHFGIISGVQLICINLFDGAKWCFPVLMIIELLSLIISDSPGTYMMIKRSCLMSEMGYDVRPVFLIEVTLFSLLFVLGYKVFLIGRRRRYGSDYTS